MNEELTLEELENDYWGKPEFDSRLVIRCHELRKKPVKDLSIEDLRVLIGQNIGLKFLVPKAISFLKENILAEGDYYEGDLLQNVLSSDSNYWNSNRESWSTIKRLFNDNRNKLKNFDTTTEIKEKWFESFQRFESLNK